MSVVQANGAQIVNWNELTLDKIVEAHNEMCLTAHDFGLTAEPVPSFNSVDEGVAACERLHVQIEKARERAANPKKERAKAKARAKRAAAKVEVVDVASSVATTTDIKPKEKVMKKAKSAKKVKSAKKAKPAKKVAAKKANGGAKRVSHGKVPGDAVIKWTADGVPSRKGTIWFDRATKVMKADGKTVDKAVELGATKADIRYIAEVKGWLKLQGGTRASA